MATAASAASGDSPTSPISTCTVKTRRPAIGVTESWPCGAIWPVSA
ncbi:MAG: hypothetical protein HYR94_10885 [Chloroflexi bacterium]|nr:hypothetical protein [Chloroflexota bacterium]